MAVILECSFKNLTVYRVMMKNIIQTVNAPKAIGPYSQGVKVRARDLFFLSGQIPLDAKTGEIINGDIELQTKQVLKNLEGVLTAAGLSWENVVKTTIYITDMDSFPRVNSVIRSFLVKHRLQEQQLGLTLCQKGL